MKRILTFFAITTILMASQCKKGTDVQPDNPYGLPNATQTGANIFACRLNEQNWISLKDIAHLSGAVINDTIGISGGNNNNGTQDIFIAVKGGLQQNYPYNINNLNVTAEFATTRLCNSNTIGYYRYMSTEGQVKFSKIDQINKIISGTFQFNIIRQNCNDTLRFTDGRFDIQYS
jgi:hypothetical protein